MNRNFNTVNWIYFAIYLSASTTTFAESFERSFDADWRFNRGDVAGAELPSFNDTKWRSLDLPHDWSIEDLPPLEENTPTLSVRPDGWKFAMGDDMARAAPEFDDHTWKNVNIPASLNGMGYDKVRTIGWFRRVIDIPNTLHGMDFLLKIGVVDDADETFFNGVKIGGCGGMPPQYDPSSAPWATPRIYPIPARLVKDMGNVLAVRFYNHEGEGGILRTLPNFQVVGPYSPESPGGPATGHTMGGTGWYRKHFTLAKSDAGKQVSILFDGVYMNSDVWLNGIHLSNRPNGYSAFVDDLTPYLKPVGLDNLLAVRVRNEGKNSRWYSGSGIYRHVTLHVGGPLHIAQWGVSITTPRVTPSAATVCVSSTLENTQVKETNARLLIQLIDPDGKLLQSAESPLKVSPNGRVVIPLYFDVRMPKLWSPDSPQLYRSDVRVLEGDKLIDQTVTCFGIRELRFSAQDGFTINGKTIKLRGACLHHDNGPLGAVAIDRAEERRVELLKSLGYNAIRTSHNPPSTVFLDACDRYGMLVLDEAFDCWEKGKNPDDYSVFFKSWWQRDLETLILRDRNHPSVILWSIGNEIPQRANDEGYIIAENLASETHRLDPTRPVTEGICNFWDQPGRPWSDTDKAFSFVDVGGYNYEPSQYESDHAKFPQRIMVGTESYPAEFADYWRLVEKHPYVIGDFVWTGIDYLGESGCGHMRLDNEPDGFGRDWPWFNAFCGDLDICGFKKPQSFYRDVIWNRSRLELMVHRPLPDGRSEQLSRWGWPDELPCWTWNAAGKTMQVSAYTRCDEVRIELNGRQIATRKIVAQDRFKASFEVPYEVGTLRAVGLINGKVVAEKVLQTLGVAAKVHLCADRPEIRASRNDLCYVTAEITDSNNQVLPDEEIPLHFTVTGAGELAAVGSGSPDKPASFRGSVRTTWRGRALAILRPQGVSGTIRLRVEADGLEADEIQVNAR